MPDLAVNLKLAAEEFVLVRSARGRKPLSGKPDQVDPELAKEDGATYVRAYGAM